MQKITLLVLLAVVALASAGLNCCGREKKSNNAQKSGQSKLKLKVNFGENEVQPESVVKILEAVGGINWQKVGTSFAPVGQPAAAPPTYVNINGRQVSASDLSALLEVLNGVNWPEFSAALAASGKGLPAGFGQSSHGHGNPTGSQKINIGGKDFDVAHVAQLLEHMGDIDWRKIEKSIEAANAGAAQQSNLEAFGQNELPHFAKLLEKMGGIDWKKIESLVEASAKHPNSGDNNGHGNARKHGIKMNEYMNQHMNNLNSENYPSTLSAASQPIPEEPKHHVSANGHSAPVPEKAKKPQTNVERLIQKWSIPPLVEEPHFHCKENCKHCKEDTYYGEEVSAPHVTNKLKRTSIVDWKTVGSKASDKN